ncbi:MAG: response regulator transcription factor [Gammaproteobacteria bacterium]|nr:response regulator transcription factor [Gammaproteobacteria bacterium]
MKILIIDDHALFSDGLSHVLKQLDTTPNITSVHNVEGALQYLAESDDYDLILLDINMPSMNGLTLLQRLSADDIYIPVIVISSETKVGIIRKAMELGAMGFIPKSHTTEEMIQALKMVLEGSIYLPDGIQAQLEKASTAVQVDGFEQRLQEMGMSKKQFQTLELVAQGLSNQQIATTLNRSEHTVKSHVRVLFQILGANNRTECVKLAKEQLLIDEVEMAEATE